MLDVVAKPHRGGHGRAQRARLATYDVLALAASLTTTGPRAQSSTEQRMLDGRASFAEVTFLGSRAPGEGRAFCSPRAHNWRCIRNNRAPAGFVWSIGWARA